MNSIKNAIVTVTLLAVGYGSYVVLQQPTDGQFSTTASSAGGIAPPNHSASQSPHVELEDASVPDVSITLDGVPRSVNPPQLSLPQYSSPTTDSVPLATKLTPASTNIGTEPKVDSARFAASPAIDQPNDQLTKSELPPLPDLITPADKELPNLAPSPNSAPQSESSQNSLAAVSPPPLVNESLPKMAAVEIAGPVAALIEPPDAALTSTQEVTANNLLSTDSFADPGVVDDVLVDNAPDLDAVQLPKRETSPSPPLEDVAFPLTDDSVGPIPPATSGDGSLAFENVWSDVQQHLRDRDLAQALKTLTPWSSDSTLNKEQLNRCMQLLDQLAGSVIYSRESILEPAYTVQAGETLEEIATRYAVPQELLAKINGIAPPYALTTGEQLKVIHGPFRASVSLFKSELTLFVGSSYAGRFPVTIGRDVPPETAFYEVAEKTNGRSYFDRRQGREIIRGEAENRYGSQWLGLRGEHITTGHKVGIHGRPATFGDDEVGSISLDPLDAEDVFSILAVGSRVEVRP